MNILLIEDNVADINLITRTMAGHNFEVCQSLECAFKVCFTFRPDAIILDLDLGGGEGPRSIRLLSYRYSNVPVIVYSGYEHDSIMEDAARNGAADFICKNKHDIKFLAHAVKFATMRGKTRLGRITDTLGELNEINTRLQKVANADKVGA